MTCYNSELPIGPPGPTGPIGPQGIQGPAGATYIPPYKVYTALLTQSGVYNDVQIQSGNLTIGVTYLINDDSGNPDFTNVGAPNNIGGTYFVATGTTPNSWGNNAASLIYNTGVPTVVVLENTIGNIWFTYDNVGYYSVWSESLFTGGKTAGFIGSVGDDIAAPSYGFLRLNSSEKYQILTQDSSQINADGVLNNNPIEIRIYP